MTHRVGIKGQVVIPKAIRDEIGIKPGDEVMFEPDGRDVRVRRVLDDPKGAASESKHCEARGPAYLISAPMICWRLDARNASARIARPGVCLTIVLDTWALVKAAAEVKVAGGLSFADAFCIATAKRLNAPLWTGDPEIIERAGGLDCAVIDLRERPGRQQA